MNKWWMAVRLAWAGRKWFKGRKKGPDPFVPVGSDEIDSRFMEAEPTQGWIILKWAYERGLELSGSGVGWFAFNGKAYFRTVYSDRPVGFPICVKANFDMHEWTAMTYLASWGDHPDLPGTFLDNHDFFRYEFSSDRVEVKGKATSRAALSELFAEMQKRIDLLPGLEKAAMEEKAGRDSFKKAVSGLRA